MTLSIFTSSSYLSDCRIFHFSSFENFEHGLPQLERPKVATTHNTMWHPKVAEANNDIRRSKVENQTMLL
jgi:hypothetical protein